MTTFLLALLDIFSKQCGVELRVLTVITQAVFDRGCSHPSAPKSLLFTVHSCLSKSSKCTTTSRSRAGAFLDRALVVAQCAFSGLWLLFVGGTRERAHLWWSQGDAAWQVQKIGAVQFDALISGQPACHMGACQKRFHASLAGWVGTGVAC